MHAPRRPIYKGTNRHGSVIVLMVLILPVALMLAAFAINAAYLELSKTEMIIATDAATRAGGRELIKTDSQSEARLRAQQLAAANAVAGKPLKLSTADIAFGTSTRNGAARYGFNPTIFLPPNALRVNAHRDSANVDGAVPTLMPNLLGVSSVPITQTAISTQMEVDVALVVDRSGSMAFTAAESSLMGGIPASAGLGWAYGMPAPLFSRWRDLVSAISVFTNELTLSPGNELLSISSYSDNATTNLTLTSNYASILSSIDIYTWSFAQGATNIGSGILDGEYALRFSPTQRTGAAKVMIVMTDGIHNTGIDPIEAATSSAAAGTMIFTVTFADEADQARMQQIATLGSGKHYHASTASQLRAVFRDIAQSLPTLLTQ